MMQSAQNRRRDDVSASLDGASSRCVLGQPQLRAGFVVVKRIERQDPVQMPLAENEDMIQALAAKRPDQAFNIWVLPGRARCDRAVAYPHPSHPVGEGLSVRSIIVADLIARRRIPWECLDDLLC